MLDVTRPVRQRDEDTENTELLEARVVVADNLELGTVVFVTAPQEDTTVNAVEGKTEDITNTVGQRNGEGGQRGDTKESVVICLPCVGKIKGRRSKMLIGAAVCVGIALLVGLIIVGIKYPAHSPDSLVKNNQTVSETNHNNHTLERESQANQLKNKSCRGWKEFGDSCYYKSTEQNSWEKSREQCLETGGSGAHLVVINNKEEQEFIGGLGNEGGAAWIGLMRTGSKWTTWVDGIPLTSQYWHSGYPDTHDDDANCTYYYWHLKGEGDWRNVKCDYERYWICERRLS